MNEFQMELLEKIAKYAVILLEYTKEKEEKAEKNKTGLRQKIEESVNAVKLNQSGETKMITYTDGTFRKRNKKWQYRFFHNKEQHSVTGATKKECYQKRTQWENETKTNKKPENITLEKWILKWFKTYKVPYQKKETQRTMLYDIKTIIEKIGSYKITELSKDILQTFLNELKYKDKNRKCKLILNAALDEAYEQEIINRNPAKKLIIPKRIKTIKRALTFQEQNLIFNKIENLEYKALYAFICCTGVRIGEALAINWKEDIDYINKRIHISKSKNGMTGEIDTPKTKSSIRYIPFIDWLIPYIKVLEETEKTYNSTKLYFKRFYEKENIKGITAHSLRHTFISNCFHAQFNIKQIQMFAGHASVDLTLNTYTHLLSKGCSVLMGYTKALKNSHKNDIFCP